MDKSNIPIRSHRKLKASGIINTISEAKKYTRDYLLIKSILFPRIHENKINYLSRTNLVDDTNCECFFTEEQERRLRVKSTDGFRGHESPLTYNSGPRFVCKINNAQVFSPGGVAITHDGDIIMDSIGTPGSTQNRKKTILSRIIGHNGLRNGSKILSGTVVPNNTVDTVAMAIPAWNNYYHWIVECLIRIRLLERYGERVGEYPPLLVPENQPSWMNESIEIIDYAGEVVHWDGEPTAVKNLVVPTFPDPTPNECQWLRDRMCERTTPTGDEKRIYISRDDATVRRVQNEEEIADVLRKFGIETYILSDLSVSEQIELFSTAELVISPHGAGLTNILFSRNIVVIEMIGSDYKATFDRLSEHLGHRYHYLKCEQSGVDISVDVQSLESVLDDIVD